MFPEEPTYYYYYYDVHAGPVSWRNRGVRMEIYCNFKTPRAPYKDNNRPAVVGIYEAC